MKVGSKRRRTKAEINEDKEKELIKQVTLEKKLKSIEKLEAELADA